MRIFAAALLIMTMSATASAETIRVAVTTSFHNSGLADVLLPAIKYDLHLDVQLLVVGTGQALKMGQAGDVDAVLVHSKAAEEAFVANGYGTHRQEIMYNDFVLIGPTADPAGIKQAGTASAAFDSIFSEEYQFVSRGDDSGTHKKEVALWASAGKSPETFGRWYKAVGAGMGAALNTAAGLDAYIMADRASWLNFGNKSGLELLFSGDPVLFNQYAFLPVNPDRHSHVKSSAVLKLEAWLLSSTARDLINGYQIGGQQLFTFNGQHID